MGLERFSAECGIKRTNFIYLAFFFVVCVFYVSSGPKSVAGYIFFGIQKWALEEIDRIEKEI